MAKLGPQGPFRAFDPDGNPLAGGKLYTYEAGTSIPKVTYTDASGTTPNSNPIILDNSGFCSLWLGEGAYKLILKDATDIDVWPEPLDDVMGDSSAAFGAQIVRINDNLVVTAPYDNSIIIAESALSLTLIPSSEAGSSFYFVAKNAGTGKVTIDPDGSETIDGLSSLTLEPGQSVIVECDGENWESFFQTQSAHETFTVYGTSANSGRIVLGEDTDNGNNTITLKAPATVSSNKELTLPDENGMLLTSATAGIMFEPLAARAGQVTSGFTVSNAADTVNDLTISSGYGVSDDGTTIIYLPSALTKQLDVAWAAGNNQGGRVGTLADDTWHVFVVTKDGGVDPDVILPNSLTPVLPPNYTKKLRVASVVRISSSLVQFKHNGDVFRLLDMPVQSFNVPGTSPVTRILNYVPHDLSFEARLNISVYDAALTNIGALVSALDESALTPTSTGVAAISDTSITSSSSTVLGNQIANKTVRTNTASEVRTQLSTGSGANTVLSIRTLAWIDRRGK